MPRFMLKKFVDSKGRLYAYDFEKKHNSYSTPSAINTEKGYYSKDAELILNQQIETPFSQVVINIFKDDKSKIIISERDIQIIYRYLYSLLTRDKSILEPIKNNLLFPNLLSNQELHDIASINGLQEAKELKIFEEYKLSFLLNNSDLPFILPTCGIYSFYSKDKEQFIIAPVNETKALLLCDKSVQEKYMTENQICIFSAKENQIKLLNEFAFLTQYKKGYGFVVSSNKQIIDELVNKYCKKDGEI